MSPRDVESGARLRWGRMLLASATVLLFLWAGTEWTAWKLAFQPQLGRPWLLLLGLPIYPPWSLFVWWILFGAEAPQVFDTGGKIAAAGGFAAPVVAFVVSLWQAREAREASTYGTARWATRRDVARAGLFARRGLVLGRFGRRYLRHDGPEHVLCFAPTRSGKGVGVVTPSLLTWSDSAVVHDIKGENWDLTAGFRAAYGRVLRFDPTDPTSDAFNPLMEIRPGPHEVRDAQNIADILVDPEGSLEKRNHWEKTSHTLLVAAILHVLYAETDKTLAGVAAFLSTTGRSIEKTLEIMRTTPHRDGRPLPAIAEAAQELENKSINERSGVVSTALSFLGLYRDPLIAQVTRRSEWRIEDLGAGDKPTTLYLVVPPSDISRTKPLIRLILNQIGRRFTEDRQARARGRRVLLLLDEFPALGRLDFFESALAFLAGYRVKALLIAQSLNQLDRAYGPNHAILDNCHVRIAFATNDERTAKRISDSLGVATELRAMKNYAGRRMDPWLGNMSVSRQETARPLMTAGEVMQLPDTDELVLVSGRAPILAKKVRYYEDRDLNGRAQRLPPAPLAPGMRIVAPPPWTGVIAPPPGKQAGLPEEAGGGPEIGPDADQPRRAEPEIDGPPTDGPPAPVPRSRGPDEPPDPDLEIPL